MCSDSHCDSVNWAPSRPDRDCQNAVALGAVSRSAYFIGTRPSSSGLGPRADLPSPNATALRAFSQLGYVPVQAGVLVQGRQRAARSGGSGPISPGTAATRTFQLAFNARLVLTKILTIFGSFFNH